MVAGYDSTVWNNCGHLKPKVNFFYYYYFVWQWYTCHSNERTGHSDNASAGRCNPEKEKLLSRIRYFEACLLAHVTNEMELKQRTETEDWPYNSIKILGSL